MTIIGIVIGILPVSGWFLVLLFDNSLDYFFSFGDGETLACLGIGIGVILVFQLIKSIVCKIYGKVELVATDKRIYGCASFGRQVDLPLDSVAAVGLRGKKMISVSTASGSIFFAGIKNREELYHTIRNLLISRQDKNEQVIKQESPASNADELKKYKELFDSGIITQEEFNAKKKQLLGL